MQLLKKHSAGLIALSACLHGEIPHCILSGDMAKAMSVCDEYRTIFDDESFYLELQENKIPDQKKVNEGLLEISGKLSIPIVATNDCHYLNASDAEAHEVLLCIQTGKTMNTPDRMRFSTNELYFKSPQDMEKAFSNLPDALKNTIKIAEQCNLEIELKNYNFPHFNPPEGETNESYFETLAFNGLEQRLEKLKKTHPDDFDKRAEIYRMRLADEIKMIRKMHFTTYFLIVHDFIKFAKDKGYPVGPGRGSAAGSLVAYSLKITEIDPIIHGLLFERFLNPERVNPPDIDVDFCMDKRDKVIEYVTQKYGVNNVAQIITFGKMLAKGVVRDVGRALDMPYNEVDKIAKLIPNDLGITIDKAIIQEPRLKELTESDPQIKRLISISKSLEGLTRHASTHAAGVVIADSHLENYLPLYKSPKDEAITTQYPMNDVDSIGLIKFDFLGLRTLTVIEKAVNLIKLNNDKSSIDLNDLPLDDKKTYELLSSGETEGIFQLESSGMKELITRIKPESIEDITALLALYRPGPLASGMVDDFIKGKHGKKSVTYELPQLEEILKETYGVILYQEQVMKIASTLASFSLADADLLRRAMGKKKASEMTKQKKKFIEGARKNRINISKAEKIFDLMAKFAEYGFNKSHSAAYAYVTFQTAYLKTHYPVEFMAALLSSEMDNTDKVVKHINECREKSIEILHPDVNESFQDFTVTGSKIRFGLEAIKNVGKSAIESIISAREEKGKFKSLLDFCEKVDLRKANKKVLESLIKCGAFDSIKIKRSQLMAVIDDAVSRVQSIQKEKAKNQLSMFQIIAESSGNSEEDEFHYPDIPELDKRECLLYEKECLGFYISGHPLDNFRDILMTCATTDAISAMAAKTEKDVMVGGIVNAFKQITTKKGEPMGFITFEDLTGFIEVVVFSDLYRRCEPLLKSDHPLLIKGKLSIDIDNENNNKIIANEILPLEKACELINPDVHIKCLINKINLQEIEKIKNILANNPGKSKVFFHLLIPDKDETVIRFGESFQAGASQLFINEIESVVGKNSVSLNSQSVTRNN
jgi:DNA polymerase-3 subunit alpha